MKTIISLLIFLSAKAWSYDPCPNKYWVAGERPFQSYAPPFAQKMSLKKAATIVLEATFRNELAGPDNDCGYIAWSETRRMEGLLDMFQATRETTYLEDFVLLADRIYESNDIFTGKIDELRGKVVFGWSSLKYTEKFKRHVHGVQSGILAEMYARFSRTVQEEHLTHFEDKALEYQSIAERALDAVNDDFDPAIGFYRFQPGVSSKHSVYPYNQGLAIGSAYIELYRISLLQHDSRAAENYRHRIDQIGTYFKQALGTQLFQGYFWVYAPGSYFEDMSHASLDLNFVLKAYEANLLFDEEDMRKFALTVHASYIKDKNEYGRYIDGFQLKGYTNWQSLTCLMLVNFDRFAPDRSILSSCEKATKTIVEDTFSFAYLDPQLAGLITNGLPKLYLTKIQSGEHSGQRPVNSR